MVYPFVQSYTDLGLRKGPILGFVVHMAEGGGTVGYLAKANPNGVSVHFVIEYSGRIVQMLRESHMHTSIRTSAIRTTDDANGFYGASAARAVLGDWARTIRTLGPNHATLAVEIEGFAASGPNVAQNAALERLGGDLRSRYSTLRGNLGHRDFADYKACPGIRIPWDRIGGHGPYAGGADMPGIVAYERLPPTDVAKIRVDPSPGVKVAQIADRELFDGALIGDRDVICMVDVPTTVIESGGGRYTFNGPCYVIGKELAIVLERNATPIAWHDQPAPTPPPNEIAAYNLGVQTVKAAANAVPEK